MIDKKTTPTDKSEIPAHPLYIKRCFTQDGTDGDIVRTFFSTLDDMLHENLDNPTLCNKSYNTDNACMVLFSEHPE